MTPKINPVPEGYRTVTACLTLKDSLAAIEFYKKGLGAKVVDVFPSLDGKGTMHAVIKIGDSLIMMGDEMPSQGCKSAEALGASPVSLYIYVPNADVVFKQAVAAGAVATMPMADMFWGDRCGSLKDPFGYAWTIATHTRDMTRQEIQQSAQAFFAKTGRP